jgi:hypothetical protein
MKKTILSTIVVLTLMLLVAGAPSLNQTKAR